VKTETLMMKTDKQSTICKLQYTLHKKWTYIFTFH
jgi:hypothetical protein